MDAQGRPRRIHLKKAGESAYEEGRAGGTITPGMLIALNSSGVYVPHPSSGAPAEVNFALEDALQGKTIDDNYVTGDLVRMINPIRGDVILGLLAPGQNVQDGTKLVSNGAGYLIAGDSDSDAIVVALEDRNANETGAVISDQRIRVRVL